MSYADDGSRRRTATAAGVAVLHVAVFYLLTIGSVVQVPLPDEAVMVFDVPAVAPAPPEDEIELPEVRAPELEGAASAANLVAKPKPIVAPPPKIPVENPPPIVAAPVAATGTEASAGSADVPGPGTGGGGEGTGLGTGLEGGGTGGGGSRTRWLKGRIKNSDYPRAAAEAEVGGTVVVHFDVGTDGRVGNCRVVSSSGNADLDRTTCRLIEKRFRYRPATDAAGRAVPDVAGWKQDWWLEPRR